MRVASDVDVGVTADVDHRRQKGPTATAVGPLLDVVTVTFDVVTHPALVALSRR
ncbi:hypothetical protein SAMN06264364_1611 [Quadrisphaera granulorum]|uniref:Uncharacterized protein n=1 Tax=Quadrisphaera granulorum TaxID=317664 RepID=A0A315ZJV2_9ACTN|nr:hypothetical protein BXY45_1611 [Quadrisphaera granulorum]SZE99198.1 hypothetical protein SAMN06264364_1611 [Quadrisphaera granulorum]